jgi:hypothetical protein
MIAVCPSCHDAIHHGELPITDETLYAWKRQTRPADVRDHIWVEPGFSTRLLLGTIAVEFDAPLQVFRLSEHNELSFRIEGEDILLANLRVSSLNGEEVVRVESNNLRHTPRADIRYRRIPGRIEIYVPATEEFIPNWALAQKRRQDRFFGLGDRLKYLGLRVESPGMLRVEGVWAHQERAVVITQSALSFCRPDMREPWSMIGDGPASVLKWAGPITTSLFGFE